jgi:murein DD-endopeptidase MepM/ murein hydrolase activator NlpD
MDKFPLLKDFWEFLCCLGRYVRYRLAQVFYFFEKIKSKIAARLYHQRGRYTRPFLHGGLAFLIVVGITLGPMIIEENFTNPWANEERASISVFSNQAAAQTETSTLISAKPESEVRTYAVQPGDTISTIAEKFGVSVDTIRWENNLESVKAIKVGQKLRILPVSGVLHKVTRGETIYSIAKKYQVDAQAIVNWPYNSFANDETFGLAVGQELTVPDGIKPKEIPSVPRFYAQAPGGGAITATGQFVWPTGGKITQNPSWYHMALDIANKDAPAIVAADSGKVTVSGWVSPVAYGNHVIIDHGNGYVTLYGHMSQVYVSTGQSVSKGMTIGKMGSTGRSTGTHLHFEIRLKGVLQNPFNYLK